MVGIKQSRSLSTTCAPANNPVMLHDYSTMGPPTQAEYFFFRPLFLCLWHIFYTLCACKKVFRLRGGPVAGCPVQRAGVRNEHYVSATQSEAEEHARIPRSHGNEDGAQGARPQTGTRQEETHGQ